MSVNTTKKGAPLYLKDNAWASKFFSLESGHNPKNKFSFACALVPKDIVEISQRGAYIKGDIENYIHLVKTVEPPKPSFDTEVVDQYNRRRVIQKKLHWEPITMTFHDDRNSLIYAMLVDYMSFYYKDFQNTEAIDWTLDTVTDLINQRDWGYRANGEKYYFHCICLAWTHGGRGTQVRLMNPIITNIQYDTLDYSDGSTPLEISVTFEYEGIRLSSINTELNDDVQLNLTKRILNDVNEIGEPYIDESFNPGVQIPGTDRTPGLGELVQAGLTFYGKHNGKPTIEDLGKDLLLRPVLGSLSGGISSWGNFSFGGLGDTTKIPGLIGQSVTPIGNQVGDVFKTTQSGTIVSDAFSFGKQGSSGN